MRLRERERVANNLRDEKLERKSEKVDRSHKMFATDNNELFLLLKDVINVFYIHFDGCLKGIEIREELKVKQK